MEGGGRLAGRVPARLAAQEGRKFGLTVGIAFIVLGGVFLWRGHELPVRVLSGVGAVLILGALLFPARLKPVERAWMAVALQISKVTTPIVMGIAYFLVLTPIALVIRRLKGNPLTHKGDGLGYWYAKGGPQNPKSDMRRQF